MSVTLSIWNVYVSWLTICLFFCWSMSELDLFNRLRISEFLFFDLCKMELSVWFNFQNKLWEMLLKVFTFFLLFIFFLSVIVIDVSQHCIRLRLLLSVAINTFNMLSLRLVDNQEIIHDAFWSLESPSISLRGVKFNRVIHTSWRTWLLVSLYLSLDTSPLKAIYPNGLLHVHEILQPCLHRLLITLNLLFVDVNTFILVWVKCVIEIRFIFGQHTVSAFTLVL